MKQNRWHQRFCSALFLKLTGSSDRHQLFFFFGEHGIDFADVAVGELLNIIQHFFALIFSDFAIFFKFLDRIIAVAADVAKRDFGIFSFALCLFGKGGTALFALLAMAGDLGGAFGPSLVGTVTQQAGDNLQSGMLMGSIFPLVMIVALILLSRKAESLRQ